MPVEQGSRQCRGGAAHIDALAFAEFTVDDHAGDALQGLGEILVRKLADILGGERIEDLGGVPLGLQRLAQAGANSVYDHLFQVAWLGARRVAARLRVNCTIATEQSHGDRRSDQRRPCDSHDLPTPDVVVSRCPFTPWPYSRETNGDRSLYSVRAGFPTETTYVPI